MVHSFIIQVVSLLMFSTDFVASLLAVVLFKDNNNNNNKPISNAPDASVTGPEAIKDNQRYLVFTYSVI